MPVRIQGLSEKLGFDEAFGRSSVMELHGQKSSAASGFLFNVFAADFIGTVVIYRKVRYIADVMRKVGFAQVI